MRPLVLSCLAVIGVAATASAQNVVGQKESVFTLSERVSAGSWVRIFSRAGDITITEGSSGNMDYRGEKEIRRGKVEDIAFRVLKDADGITVCAVFDEDDECTDEGVRGERHWGRYDWRDRAKVHVTVKVPRGVKVRTASGNGDVSLAAAAAEARVSSGNGKVRVASVTGRVDASSGNGDVSVDNVGGAVHANSGNGDVIVSTSNGPINASSGNGDIRVAMDRLIGDEDMEFSSGNGHIEVTVPSDFSAVVEASSGNGKVVTDFPITITGKISPSHLRGTIGGGGRRLRMTTGNGSMEIRKKT